jgi:sugar O-acyltransferase (sialic acid O-acetyltransferase NeuD family)
MIILGMGGHAKVIIDILKTSNSLVENIYDDDLSKNGLFYNGIEIKTPISNSIHGDCIISIGDNKVRKVISEKLTKSCWKTVIHPSAIIANDVTIGEGCVIMAGVIIQTGSCIGKHVIINTGACIDHDCIIDDYVHIAPNVSIAGGVKISNGSFIGIGSTIIHNINIGQWCIIGAGSVVIKDVNNFSKVVGNPIRIIK